VALPGRCFDGTVNEDVLHRAVITFLSNQAAGHERTLNPQRGLGRQSRSRAQKGTGRAAGLDAGSALAHGGRAHGPHPRSYRLGIPKKDAPAGEEVGAQRRAREGALVIVDAPGVREAENQGARRTPRQAGW